MKPQELMILAALGTALALLIGVPILRSMGMKQNTLAA